MTIPLSAIPPEKRAGILAQVREPVSDMNKTEARYAEVLEHGKLSGLVRDYRFQAVTLKLADDTRYTPDFFVVQHNGLVRFDEVKGFWRDDALVKIKVAAAQFPWFIFQSVQAIPKKEGGGWKCRVF